MKSSLGKLKRLAIQKNDGKETRVFQPLSELDELAQASQEMQDMRNCYDSLLSAAAATANSAYEFSESLREMGDCLLEKTTLFNDEESGKALLLLATVQFELQKLVDHYRSNIFATITNPSESLLNELQTVEDMKRQCDEKRSVYEYMMAQQNEKARSKRRQQRLQTAHDEYEDEATLCVFRLKSLKQGQSRSLLTQAARHHTAQLNFFGKAYRSLEAVDPHVKQITEKHRIDYQVSGLNDGDDAGDNGEYGYDSNDYGELSFDHRQNKPGFEVISTSRNSMELDQDAQSFPTVSMTESTEQASLDKIQGDPQIIESAHRVSSHSAPITAEKRFDPADQVRKMHPPSTQKFPAYVLPTPVDAKSSTSRTSHSVPRTRPASLNEQSNSIWHSSPLENKMHKRDSIDNLLASALKEDSVYNDRSRNEASTHLPSLADGHSFSQNDTLDASDHKKIKLQALSGPLSSNRQPIKPGFSASGPMVSSELPVLASGLISQAPTHLPPSSSKLSCSISPSSVSPPKINELHELPRPPGNAATKSRRPSGSILHSAPLISRSPEASGTNRSIVAASNTASRLPIPPSTIARSFSIPSRNQRATLLQVSKLLESQRLPKNSEEITSP
ncbi:hypothetical protein Nepgr_016895 [Nepenthes gracilis]|uniref:BAR domain-containing protein n=1 Tax=Nepenthes gracilis TaxID=150966 RepID=A0AAD3SQI9_NEPGR|nr:hypothetical protein Nepgr_016895 [Nepenthes gracilis]